MNPRENRIGDDNVISESIEDALKVALKVALRGAFEVAMEIAVKETSKLMAQLLQDVRGQIHETQQENITLKLRLKQINAEHDNPKQLTADPNQSRINSDPEMEFKTEHIKHTEPSDQDISSFQTVFTQVLVKTVKTEPEDPVLDGRSGSDARPDQRSNEECGLDRISMAQSKFFWRLDSEQPHSERGSLDEGPSHGTSENTLSFNGCLSSLSTPFDGLYQSEDKNSIFQTLQNCRDQLGTYVQSSLYVCKLCGHSFHSESNLHNHHNRYHSTVLKTLVTGADEIRPRKKGLLVFAPGSSLYHCTVCNQNFSCQKSFRTHTQIHTGEHSYTCTLCSLQFCHVEALIRHFRVHIKKNPVICLECGKRFVKRAGLKFHMMSHRPAVDTLSK